MLDEMFQSKWFPWAAGGLGALVVYMVFFGRGGGSSSGDVSYSAANLALVGQQAQLGAQVEAARINAETTDTAAIAGMAQNLVAARYGYELGAQQVAAGVHATDVAGRVALRTEHDQAITTRQQIAAALPIARVQAAAMIHAADTQASTARDIAHTQQSTSFFDQVLGTITSLGSKLLPLALGGA